MGDKTFNLTWNNHLANLSGLFEGLYKSGALTDTTLACHGGMLRAHRLVLAACSPFFERVFKEHYGDQPILILKGVAVEEMECLLDFMYRGSIDVAEEHLGSLIKTATDLEIRGLSADSGNNVKNSYSRMQKCNVETREHNTEYKKDTSSTSFLQKQTCLNPMEATIKMEEIEVEDDPMVMESHEGGFEDTLMTVEEEQNKSTPPSMYNRETRYKGQKRVAVGRNVRNHDQLESRSRIEISLGADSKHEMSFNGASTDPTVPAIQMNEDEQDQVENMDSPTSMEEEEKPTGMRKRADSLIKNDGAGYSATGKVGGTKDGKNQYKPFSCDLCTLAFTRASHLARHRRVHTGERPFACSLCPRLFARQDKLKQHLDSHLQLPTRKAMMNSAIGHAVSASVPVPGKAKRGRPRKVQQVTLDQSAMDEIMKFGEFSSMLNKSQNYNSKNDTRVGLSESRKSLDESETFKDKDNYACQVENGKDIV